jgi:dsDNA-binding SOS-regulon protein
MVSRRGIEANPEKIATIMKMGPPACLKDAQKLTGCMAALSRFISRLGVRGLPFFKLLKKQDHFMWPPGAQEACEELKEYLTKPPILVAPRPGETLQLYISATTNVVSTVLVVEREEPRSIQKVQHPVYFISEVLSESKVKYFQIMKLANTVLITSRKLVHYFQAHRIEIQTSLTLGEVFRNQDATGKITK